MKALIFKEWREHLKWVPLPGLVILLVFFIENLFCRRDLATQ